MPKKRRKSRSKKKQNIQKKAPKITDQGLLNDLEAMRDHIVAEEAIARNTLEANKRAERYYERLNRQDRKNSIR